MRSGPVNVGKLVESEPHLSAGEGLEPTALRGDDRTPPPATTAAADGGAASDDGSAGAASEPSDDDAAQRFRLAWEHAPIGMAMVGLHGNWMDTNPALCELLGRPREQLRGDVVEEVTHPEDLDRSIHRMESMLARQGDGYHLQKRYLHSSGRVVHARLTASLVTDRDGEPSYVLAQIVDTTTQRESDAQLRRTIAELERSNQVLSSFAEVASHDLTSPLGTAHGLVELALHHFGDELSAEVTDLLRRATRQTERALASTRTLLELASPQPAEVRREELDLHPLVLEVLDGLSAQLDGVELGVDVAVDEGMITTGDRVQLGLVFQNLLANAVKYRSPDGVLSILIHAEVAQDGLLVHVDDNGVGLEGEDVEQLFELRVRGGGGGEEVDGLGIGLATSRRIVEHHGGSITAGASPAGGARFSLWLPAADATAAD